MSDTDQFGEYVRDRLEAWGFEFAYHRDRERLGHRSKDMLQILIEHRGEMPPKVVGFKPLEVDREALEIEWAVHDLFKQSPMQAWALRAYYCTRGRRGVERYDAFRFLCGRGYSRRRYFDFVREGEAYVRACLCGIARAG